MYDVPVSDALKLLEHRDARDKRAADTRARDSGGGLRGFHNRVHRRTRGGHR